MNDAMPMGTEHVVTGLLLTRRRELVLDVDGGGTWRLGIGGAARGFLGRRVTVQGLRAGFDLLEVKSFWPAGQNAPKRRWWWRLVG